MGRDGPLRLTSHGLQVRDMVLQTHEVRGDRASACVSCATLPAVEMRAGSLVVTGDSVEHRLLVAEVLEGAGWTPNNGRDGRMTCAVPAADLPDVAADLALGLPAEVLDACGASISEAAPGQHDVADRSTLRALLRNVERGWLTEILGHGRLDTHLQPIVDLSTGTPAPFAHECLTRGRTADGETIPASRLFAAADRAALMFHLDRSARLTSIANAARYDAAGRYFVNFTPTSIYNPAYCLRSTVEAVNAGGIAPDQVTFEVIESVRMQDLPHLDKIFTYYRQITGGPTKTFARWPSARACQALGVALRGHPQVLRDRRGVDVRRPLPDPARSRRPPAPPRPARGLQRPALDRAGRLPVADAADHFPAVGGGPPADKSAGSRREGR